MNFVSKYIKTRKIRNLKKHSQIDKIIELLIHENDSDFTLMLINILVGFKTKEAIKPLLTLLGNDSPRVRKSVRNALEQLGVQKEELFEGYIKVISHCRCSSTIIEAINELREFRNDKVINGLINLLDTWNDDVQNCAKSALKSLGIDETDERVINKFLSMIKRDYPKDAVIDAIISLGSIKCKTAFRDIAFLMESKRGDVRKVAHRVFYELASKEFADEYLYILNNDFYCLEVRTIAAEILIKLEDNRAVEPIIKLLSKRVFPLRMIGILSSMAKFDGGNGLRKYKNYLMEQISTIPKEIYLEKEEISGDWDHYPTYQPAGWYSNPATNEFKKYISYADEKIKKIEESTN